MEDTEKVDSIDSDSTHTTDRDNVELATLTTGSSGHDMEKQRKKMPYFEFLSNELVFHILNEVSEKQMMRFGLTCRRFYELMDEPSIWNRKARNWSHLKDSIDSEGSGDVRAYYVNKYQLNVRKAKELKQQERKKQRKERNDRLRKIQVDICDYVCFNYVFFEIPVLLLLLCWAILMSLRADEVILSSYFVVFVPNYIAHIYVLLSIVFAIYTIEIADFNGLNREYKKNFLSFVLKNSSGFKRSIVFFTSLASAIFFLILSISMNSDGWIDAAFSVIPLVLVSTPLYLMCCGRCTYKVTQCTCRHIAKPYFGTLFYYYMIWTIIFFILRAGFWIDYNWIVTFSPIWAVCTVCMVFYFMLVLAMILEMDVQERIVFLKFSFFFLSGMGLLVSWLVLLCLNLEALENDLPTYSWTFIGIPLFVFFGVVLTGHAYWMYKIN